MNNTGFASAYTIIEDLEEELSSKDLEEKLSPIENSKNDNHSLKKKVSDYFANPLHVQPAHYIEVAESIGEKDADKVKRELDILTNEGRLYSKGKKYGTNPSHKIKL